MPNVNALKLEEHVIVFGEINLDIYVEIHLENNYPPGSVIPSIVHFKTGGNTWNIARMLALLGRSITFICTSTEDDLPSVMLRSEIIPSELELFYIPKLGTTAPRFIAIDKGAELMLRTVYIPQQHQPTNEQLVFASNIIRKECARGAKIAVLASSIEPQLLAHIIHECRSLSIRTFGTVSSAPSARQYYPHLQNLSMLVLNSSEARTLLGHLTLRNNDDDLASALC